MELYQWEQYSFDLALHLVDNASRKSVNTQPTNGEKLKALSLMAGCHWNEKDMRKVGPTSPRGSRRELFGTL